MSTRSSLRALLLVAYLFLVALITAGPAAGQAQPGKLYLPLIRKPAPTRQLVISSDRDGQTDLYIVNSRGAVLSRLTNTSEQELFPAWSPDGQLIAFVQTNIRIFPSRSSLHVIGIDGKGKRDLTPTLLHTAQPVWSPDGSQIAFEGTAEADASGDLLNPDIYVIGRDGTGLRRLTNTVYGELSPMWSPDGRRLAFVGWDGGRQVIDEIGADGNGLRVLSAIGSGPLAWSPDGAWVAFSGSESQDPISYMSIYIQPAAGGEHRLLAACERGCNSPSWSPDGSRLAFVETLLGPGEDRMHSALCIIGADGKGRTPILDDVNIWSLPAWAPDGQTLAVTIYTGERFEVLALSPDGSDLRSLGQGSHLSWGP